MPLRLSHVSSALIAAMVGFAGTLVLIVAAAQAIGALGTAMKDEAERCPALLAFAVSAAGVSSGGIGAAFWGLAAGLLAHGLEHGLRAMRLRDLGR